MRRRGVRRWAGSTQPTASASPRPELEAQASTHLRQMAYMRLTEEMRKGSDLARLRLLLSVPRPRRW